MSQQPHPLQGPVDNLVDYLCDANLLYEVIEDRSALLTAERKKNGSKAGAGPPTAANKSLNRAVVVAAVGALEAFCEDLALTAQGMIKGTAPPDAEWYRIAGSRGMVQTPSPKNIRKMFWTFFRYDPATDWDITVQVSKAEIGPGSTNGWRGLKQCYQQADAISFLDTMVKVRHGFAHQDTASQPKAVPGIATHTPAGKVSIHSHHAWNSICALVQISILTARGLAMSGGLNGSFRWSKAMERAYWLDCVNGTAAGQIVKNEWSKAPAGLT